jgi:UDP-3-O-[3-hydroxymyristoyl] glucosamine N-acyltransferase
MGVNCRIDIGCQIGSDGFGYEWSDEGWRYRPHPFGVAIGDNVDIGANTVIHAGRWRDTTIGQGTKIDALVFIAHNVVIGRDCLIVANAMIAGSVHIGDEVIIGGSASIRPGVTVGDRAIIGMGAAVVTDVPPDEVWAGTPARYMRDRHPGETL